MTATCFLCLRLVCECVGGGGPHETELWISKYAFTQHFFRDVCGAQGGTKSKAGVAPKGNRYI